MSGIFGRFHRNGQPADPAILERMSQAAARRGPHGSGLWIDGPVALGHRMLHATPESVQERQPHAEETGLLRITWDGRLDNRAELTEECRRRGLALRSSTDVELALRAYEMWGEACPSRLLGDFAFAIWDGRRRLLFCARDVAGIKPFYYHLDGACFTFSSELQVLLRAGDIPKEPNEGMIAEYLARDVTSREETLYRGILRLLPAHTLTVTATGAERRRYWDIDPDRRVRYRSGQEYADHFRCVMGEAVRCRNRSATSSGILLSGGLDSTTVFVLANQGGATVPGFSLVFPGNRISDESDYIRSLLEKSGGLGVSARIDEPGRAYYDRQIRESLDFPDYPNLSAWDSLARLSVEKGARVLLSGIGGDQWFSGQQGRLARLLKTFGVSAPISRLLVKSHQQFRFRGEAVPKVLRPEFLRSVGFRERVRPRQEVPRFRDFTQDYLYPYLCSGWESLALEMIDRWASGFGIDERHPFYDRRVIELSFALPAEQRFGRGYGKFVLREAMKGLLPESIRVRKTKADFSQLFPETLERQGGEGLFRGMETAAAGWILESEAHSMYKRMRRLYEAGDARYTRDIWQLSMIAGIELWCRTVFPRS